MSVLASANRLLNEIKIVSQILPSAQFLNWLSRIPQNISALLKTKSLGIIDQSFGDSFTVNWNQKILRFSSLDFGVIREIYGHHCYINPGELKNAKSILDLGANGGAFTIFALAEAPQAKVHAVEVQSDFIKVIENNAIQNEFSDRLTTETAVVGGFYDDWTKAQLNLNPNLYEFNIRNYIESVGSCDFLKCDVQCGEFNLFKGDVSWIHAVKKMALEYHPNLGDINELKRILESQGLKIHQVDHGCLGYFYCSQVESV